MSEYEVTPSRDNEQVITLKADDCTLVDCVFVFSDDTGKGWHNVAYYPTHSVKSIHKVHYQ